MLRRDFLLSAPLALAQSQPKPNVVLILADDLGSKDLGYLGGPERTPNLDKLAARGVRFTNLAACPLCSPTRAALLTGRHPIRYGLGYTVVRPWSTYGLPLSERTMADSFRQAGYQTAIYGKWHLGHFNRRQLPTARGFDEFYGHVNGEIDYFNHTRNGGLDWQRNGTGLVEEGYTTDLLSKGAANWISRRNPAKPFFLYLPFNAPHAPLQAPPGKIASYSHIADEKRRRYCAMVECLDDAVGRVLNAVANQGPTIIMFLSDNGGPRAQGADNGELRAGKATVFEGGTRVPGILAAPGLAPGDYRPLASVMDLFPTLADAAGISLQPANPLDGQSHWNSMRGNQPGPRNELFSSVQGGADGTQYAYREGPWKLVRIESKTVEEQLFHLEEDPFERTDRLAAVPATASRLRESLLRWARYAPKGSAEFSGVPHPGWVAPKDFATVAVD
jgi:arylsulfatase A-like enzyme